MKMNVSWKSLSCIAALATIASGCQSQTSPPPADGSAHVEANDQDHAEHEQGDDGESDVNLAMAELSTEDRKEAEAQKFCAVMNTSLLGSMGAPLKLDVKGQPVFVCCAGCKSKALKNPDETLTTVAKLKAENGRSKE
jgi:hypothetical protein